MKVINCFQFDRIAEEIAVDEGLDCWVGEEVFVVDNEAIVHISVVCEVEIGVVKAVIVELLPGVLDEGDGDIAECWRHGSGAKPGEWRAGQGAGDKDVVV